MFSPIINYVAKSQHPSLFTIRINSFISPITLILFVILFILTACTEPNSITEASDDPEVTDSPIAYITRPIPTNPDNFDLSNPSAFNPNARLFIADRADSSTPIIELTSKIIQHSQPSHVNTDDFVIDIKDLSVSFDGETIYFAARIVPIPVNANLSTSTWNLWMYNLTTNSLDFIITDSDLRDVNASKGGSQDTSPVVTPDGSIVFLSTRQVSLQNRLQDEEKPAFIAGNEGSLMASSVLHIYNPATESIKQLSFSPSHDRDPAILDNGKIIFSRWDNNAGHDRWSLYTISPIGTELSRHYGYHSVTPDKNSPGYFQTEPLPNGEVLALYRASKSLAYGGDIKIINTRSFVDKYQSTWDGSSGKAESSLTNTTITVDGSLSPGGYFSAFFPIYNNTNWLLVSWSPCRVIEDSSILPCTATKNSTTPAPPLYSLWLYNRSEHTQTLVTKPTEGTLITDVVAGVQRPRPSLYSPPFYSFDDSLTSDIHADNYGLLNIHSVYNVDGIENTTFEFPPLSNITISDRADPILPAYSQRPARFIRLIKPAALPNTESLHHVPKTDLGDNAQFMREILGYVPIEPDGSVSVKVPANVPFMISVLDDKGRRISPRHNNWLQLAPGEVRNCIGCHTDSSPASHGRVDDPAPSYNFGAQSLLVQLGTGIGFPNTKVDRSKHPLDFLDSDTIGSTMAETYNHSRPIGNTSVHERELSLQVQYTDEWADDPNNADQTLDYRYDNDWGDFEYPITSVTENANRIVINYIDHIQPIWERERVMSDEDGNPFIDNNEDKITSCVGCHRSNDSSNIHVGNDPVDTYVTTDPMNCGACHTINEIDTVVPKGQLDLTSTNFLDDAIYRSYQHLLQPKIERAIDLDDGQTVVDRTRSCIRIETYIDETGAEIEIEVPFDDPNPAIVAPAMSMQGAIQSAAFFNCFEGGECGAFVQQGASDDCEELSAWVQEASIDHSGWLTDAELWLIIEWLDIGGQYYNDVFHPNLNQSDIDL